MGAYIRGMEMPTNCLECAFYRRTDPIYDYCCISSATPKGYVPKDCPLVEVPPHGRLIDADELRWCYDNSDVADDVITKENYDQLKVAVAVVRQTIDDAPTIIEAEKGET